MDESGWESKESPLSVEKEESIPNLLELAVLVPVLVVAGQTPVDTGVVPVLELGDHPRMTHGPSSCCLPWAYLLSQDQTL